MITQSPYTGVSWHKGAKRYRSCFQYKGKFVNMGYWDQAELAAQAVDFGRLMCYGFDPAKWSRQSSKLNFDRFAQSPIIRVVCAKRLVKIGVLSEEEAGKRLAEFNALRLSAA